MSNVVQLNVARTQQPQITTPVGYTQVMNEILEALAQGRFSQHQYQVLMVILRKTAGWHKEWDYIAGQQFAEATSLKRQDCSKALNQLIELGVLERRSSARSAIRINPDIQGWLKAEKGSHDNRVNRKTKTGSVKDKTVQSVNQKMEHTKEKKQNRSSSYEEAAQIASDAEFVAASKPALPSCPHRQLLALWAEVIPETVQHNPNEWNNGRSGYRHLVARWKEGFSILKRDGNSTLYHDHQSALQWWRAFFEYLRKSPFLMEACRPFCLEWVVKKANFLKVKEGNYHA